MAGFIRGKQTGTNTNFSAGILSENLVPNDQGRFGINSQIGFVRSLVLPLIPTES